MTLTLVPKEDQVGPHMGGKRKLYREKENKKKEVAEKRRIERIRAKDAFDEIEQRNRQIEGKY